MCDASELAPSFVRQLHFSFHFLDDTMPPRIAKHIQDMRARNPRWELLIWNPQTSRALVADKYPQHLSLYDGFPHAIQRSDFSRLAILHAFGGVYCDVDYKWKQDLEAFVSFVTARFPKASAYVNASPNTVILPRLTNSLMASAVPGHDFWTHVMNNCNLGWGLTDHLRVLSAAGPQALDRAWAKYPKRKRQTVGVLPLAAFNPCGVCSRGTTCGSGSGVIAIHDHAGSWTGGCTRTYNALVCDKWWVLAVVLLGVALLAMIAVAATFAAKCKSSAR